MKLIISNSNNPFYNLAIEEWAIRNIDTSNCDYLFLYENTDCVVIGRNQNVFQEVNLAYCKQNKIDICRRVSGGGTVFHDMKNLNWTFISKFDSSKVNNYKEFSSSIIKVLQSLGLKAILNERNAIMIGKTKVSGQAQFTNRKNILSHGTLLVNSNVEKLNNSTILKNIKVESKATKSVRSEVKTIVNLLGKNISIKQLKDLIIKENSITEFFDIETKGIQTKIKEIQKTYCTEKWIYQRSSNCTIYIEIDGEKLRLKLEKAIITEVKNKKGEKINSHPLLNSSYLKLFTAN